MLDVFFYVSNENENYVLLLVGVGPKFNEVKEKISKSSFKDRIILYGETTKPEDMYFAMDIFAFPSLYEGLPLTLVEAQITGIPCIISDRITDETKLSNMVIKLPITDTDIWENQILSAKIYDNQERENFIKLHSSEIDKFNIDECVKEVEKKYKSLVGEKYE